MCTIIVLTAIGCKKPVRFTEADNGGTTSLAVDRPFEVLLKGNPTTGYLWQVVDLDPSILQQVGEPAYKSESSALGSAGRYTFRFKTVGPGQTLLKLIYHRPFEQGVPPVEVFELNMTVEAAGG